MNLIQRLVDAIIKQPREFVGFMGLSQHYLLSNDIKKLIVMLENRDNIDPKPLGLFTPDYGDLIVIEPAPEQCAQMRIVTYDKSTAWIDGDMFYILKKAK